MQRWLRGVQSVFRGRLGDQTFDYAWVDTTFHLFETTPETFDRRLYPRMTGRDLKSKIKTCGETIVGIYLVNDPGFRFYPMCIVLNHATSLNLEYQPYTIERGEFGLFAAFICNDVPRCVFRRTASPQYVSWKTEGF